MISSPFDFFSCQILSSFFLLLFVYFDENFNLIFSFIFIL
jgi:hypothetical protein